MRSLVFSGALFLALPASAARPSAGRPSPDSRAGEAMGALAARPPEAQRELRRLYERYLDAVARLRDEGWRGGLLSGAIVEDPDARGLPARQALEAARRRAAEVAALEERSPGASGAYGGAVSRRLEDARAALAQARKRAARSKGLCIDWSDALWAEFSAAAPEHWSVADQRRRKPPFHAAAVLCSPPEDPGAVCLAFDAWPRGQADVYDFPSWDEGSFEGRIPPEFFLHRLGPR